MARTTVLRLLPLALLACAGDDGAATVAVVRDSAAVRIVENPDAAPATLATLAAEPTLAIGDEAEGEDPLFRVQGVRRTGDGGVIVANGGSAQLRRYDAQGALRWTAGAKGGGPGEFQTLAWAAVLPGDSVLAYDAQSRRFSVFDGAGAFARSFQVLGAGGQPAALRPVGLTRDGGVLATLSGLGGFGAPGAPPPQGVVRDTARVVRVALDGTVSDTLARVPGDERMIRVTAQSINILVPPFAPRLVVAAGDGFVAPWGDGWQLARWAPDGRLQRLVRVAGAERPVAPADLDAHVARVTDGMEAAQRQGVEEGLRALPLPSRMPSVGRMLHDAQGRLWAMDFVAPSDTVATWRVFDPEGRQLGVVRTPTALTVHEIGADWLLGVFRNEDDVEEVRAYALREVPPR